jgi:hypothetical protein
LADERSRLLACLSKPIGRERVSPVSPLAEIASTKDCS